MKRVGNSFNNRFVGAQIHSLTAPCLWLYRRPVTVLARSTSRTCTHSRHELARTGFWPADQISGLRRVCVRLWRNGFEGAERDSSCHQQGSVQGSFIVLACASEMKTGASWGKEEPLRKGTLYALPNSSASIFYGAYVRIRQERSKPMFFLLARPAFEVLVEWHDPDCRSIEDRASSCHHGEQTKEL